jgi:hypothetical protein
MLHGNHLKMASYEGEKMNEDVRCEAREINSETY